MTVPPSSVSLNRSRLIASNETECVPTGRVVDQCWPTPLFQVVPDSGVMAWAVPSITTETWSAAEPSRLRYETEKVMVVPGVPVLGATTAPNSLVGPSTARTGTTKANTMKSAANTAASGFAAGR